MGGQNDERAALLSVLLPGASGFEVVRRMQSRQIHTLVLMLTARSTVANKVTGLNAGADDSMKQVRQAPEDKCRAVTAFG